MPISRTVQLAMLACVAPVLLHPQAPPPADPRVDTLMVLLRNADAEVMTRRQLLALAQSRVLSAGARAPATLSVEVEGIPNAIDITQAQQARLLLERQLFTGARAAGRRGVATVEVDNARLALVGAERAVEWRGLRAIARWHGALAIVDRLASEDALLQEAESALRARFAGGEARYVDVLRIRTERLRVQSERARQLAAAAIGRRELLAMIPDTDTSAVTIEAILDTLLAERGQLALLPELLPLPPIDSLLRSAAVTEQASIGVRRAEAAAQLLRAEQRTDVTAGAGLQRFQSNSGSFVLGPSIGAAFTLPFTARGSQRAQRATATLGIAAATAKRTRDLVHLRRAVHTATARYDAAREQVRVFDTALLIGAREERESALSGFRTGQLSLLELIDFERALARAEIDRLAAVIDAVDALADTYLLLAGTKSSADLTAVESAP